MDNTEKEIELFASKLFVACPEKNKERIIKTKNAYKEFIPLKSNEMHTDEERRIERERCAFYGKQRWEELKADFDSEKSLFINNKIEEIKNDNEIKFSLYENYKKEFYISLHNIINPYLATLALRRSQTVYTNCYGTEDNTKWIKEINTFIRSVLCENILVIEFLKYSEDQQDNVIRAKTKNEIASYKKKVEVDLYKNIDNFIKCYSLSVHNEKDFRSIKVEDLDPIQFEHFCAEILRVAGWKMQVTKSSGDQGIDLIGLKGDIKAVFQCKKYSQPVGNSAVQEIIAGKIFEQADKAAVISNNTYTSSAKQLANALGVHLLHFNDLPTFGN
ncbi:restriction endonuclease [Actimicrobium sp. CCC2.4]|uniref:restriction endonuclease n=1 Tax=Actimicrobium sp. CCC2.4 TaxID=3048606 RepID=UPI002AC9047E|nr:restriction endonuclease [Actimicrobium sp. CCC2.4]MEB0134636.1 restriction endonuclease [Actimicrobium sp. CCC2.4]WPX30579.1 restriction endonuclease [Actimicrobium sp. CCC2.4]